MFGIVSVPNYGPHPRPADYILDWHTNKPSTWDTAEAAEKQVSFFNQTKQWGAGAPSRFSWVVVQLI